MNPKKKPAKSEEKPEETLEATEPIESPAQTGWVMTQEDKAISIKRQERVASVAGIFDLFKDSDSLLSFVNLIRGISGEDILKLFDTLGHLLRVKEPLSSKTGILLRVEAALKVLECVADITPGERDDELVEKARLMLNAGLLPIIAEVVSSLLKHIGDDEVSESAVSDVLTGPQSDLVIVQSGISWSVLIPILVSIIRIIREVK